MKRILILLTTLGIVFACEKKELDGQEADRENLERIRKEIDDRITGVPCENAEEWDFTALGSKACGGPQEYIAYPLTIDTEELLTLVEEYTEAEKEYNTKYGIISDCMAIPTPTGVRCDNGEPVLVYTNMKPND